MEKKLHGDCGVQIYDFGMPTNKGLTFNFTKRSAIGNKLPYAFTQQLLSYRLCSIGCQRVDMPGLGSRLSAY